MDSIDQGATIRIGFRQIYFDSHDVSLGFFNVPTYSLKINKKTILIATSGPERDYLKVYGNAAKEIAKLMNKNSVKNFVVYNGERIRMMDHNWVSCDYVPNDGEEIFKKTLEGSLN